MRVVDRVRNGCPVDQIARVPDHQGGRIGITIVGHVEIPAHAQDGRIGIVAGKKRVLEQGRRNTAHRGTLRDLAGSLQKGTRQRRR